MADRVSVAGAAAGTGGAAYRKILTYSGKTTGTYVLNETNFTGLGQYLPCLALVLVTAGGTASSIQVSTDNGTTWLSLAAGTSISFGLLLYLDTANTFRVNLGAAGDVRIYVQ